MLMWKLGMYITLYKKKLLESLTVPIARTWITLLFGSVTVLLEIVWYEVKKWREPVMWAFAPKSTIQELDRIVEMQGLIVQTLPIDDSTMGVTSDGVWSCKRFINYVYFWGSELEGRCIETHKHLIDTVR